MSAYEAIEGSPRASQNNEISSPYKPILILQKIIRKRGLGKNQPYFQVPKRWLATDIPEWGRWGQEKIREGEKSKEIHSWIIVKNSKLNSRVSKNCLSRNRAEGSIVTNQIQGIKFNSRKYQEEGKRIRFLQVVFWFQGKF